MSRRRLRAEHAWWLGVALWGAALALWRPDPPRPYEEAPSAKTNRSGFNVLYELVHRETRGARRLLGRASDLPGSVGVLVVLSPSEPVPEGHREEMLDWVASSGGTLIVGHPLRSEEWQVVSHLTADTAYSLSRYEPLGEVVESRLVYQPYGVDPPRQVPGFRGTVGGTMEVSEYGGAMLLLDEWGRAVATVDPHGAGAVIQLTSTWLLDNEELGNKRTHLFAAALIDEAGRDTVWAFDEAHEGIEPRPQYLQLIGSSDWNPVFLQLALLALFVYWRASARMGRPAHAPDLVGAREVATQARDTGDFYFRAGESRWALARNLEWLKIGLKERGAASEIRQRALAAIGEAEAELANPGGDVERHARLIRVMAVCQQQLTESSKGKKT